MESNNTKIHFATGVKMLYLFPQISPLPIPYSTAIDGSTGWWCVPWNALESKTYLRKLDSASCCICRENMEPFR